MFKRWDNISKVALIYFFSSLYFYLPVITIYYQQKGLSFLQMGSLWGITTITIFLSEIPTGILADKLGRKTSIIFAMLFQLVGEVLFLFAGNYLHFIFISIISGIGFAFQSGCIQALVYDFLKDEGRDQEMKKIWGNITALGQMGFIIGAVVSSYVVSSTNTPQISLAIVMTVISVMFALVISLLLKEPKNKYKHTEKSSLDLLKTSIKLISCNASLRKIILFGIFTTPFLAFLNSFQPPYFDLSHVPLYWLGISRAVAGIIALFCLRYAYKLEEIFKVNGILIATLLPAVLYLFMSIVFHPIFATMLFILNYSTMRLQEPLLADYYNMHIKSEVRSTTLSAINMLSSVYIAIMGLVIGKIADTSIPLTFLFMGIIILGGSLLFRVKEDSFIQA